MNKSVILTGIRVNGELHLGSYLGAIMPIINMQKLHGRDQQINMFVPDLHSFTTPVDHSELYAQTIKNLKIYVAAGLDIHHPDTYVYRQSCIPAHSELTVILNNFAYYGELSRMTQFKEKSESQKEQSITVGLFDYPVLMAADILLYGAEWVPVGDDQKQHLELTRDLGLRFNNKFGDIFTIPHEWKKQLKFTNLDTGVRIRSLRHPENKMSKSITDPAGTILLSDNPDDAAKKIMGATTDSVGTINYDWEAQPGITNLLQIIALLSGKEQVEVNDEWTGKERYGDLKKRAAELVRDFLSGLQQRLEKVEDSVVLDALKANESIMNKKANETLLKVQKAVGLREQ